MKVRSLVRSHRFWLGALLVLACGVGDVRSAGSQAASKRALVFAKVLSYEQRLADTKGGSVAIAILHSGDASSKPAAERWHQEFKALGSLKIHDVPVHVLPLLYDPGALASSIKQEGIDVLVATDGVSAAAIAQVARASQILSAADTRAGMASGLSLGVFEEQGKPKIVINVRSAKAEGANFSAKLLQLAELM